MVVQYTHQHKHSGSNSLLRASVVAQGHAIVIYEEVDPTKLCSAAAVHRKFMEVLRTMLPTACEPMIIADAGFRMSLGASGIADIGAYPTRRSERSRRLATSINTKKITKVVP